MRAISRVTFLVDDYDEAIDWFRDALGFVLIEDAPMGDKRWVVVSPRDDAETQLLLARPRDDAQNARLGNQTGGRVFLILHTDDFARDHAAMTAAGPSPHRCRRTLR